MNDSVTSEVHQQACAAALAELPLMNPRRLAKLLAGDSPAALWQSIASGRVAVSQLGKDAAALISSWRTATNSVDPLEVFERYRLLNVGIWHRRGHYPEPLNDDEWAPAVVFAQGTSEALENARVAIIGTRHCTREGRDIAHRLGRELSEAGVTVVSGLALGIDGAAHEGALEAAYGAPPIAVVGSGLDVVYPKRHRDLWRAVANKGLLITESPLGAPPEAWRFPARNRIIAALADLVVVVESHDKGGSLLTVNEAAERGIQVMAVPGSVNHPASRGTNELLRDGCAPVLSSEDVLLALGCQQSPRAGTGDVARVVPAQGDEPVFDAVTSSTSTDEILGATGLGLGAVAAALVRLEARGLLINEEGWWRRRIG